LTANPVGNIIAEIISRYHWWHTIEVSPGLVTPGAWDIRHLPSQIPWPTLLAGGRCLDVGTRDGFWAFEMERRGASEILAIDVAYSEMDIPYHLQVNRSTSVQQRPPDETFNLLAGLLGSKARFKPLNIYDLNPAEVGQFDVIFVGYMLHQLRDPLRALEIVRSVCRGCVIVLDEVMFFHSIFSREPLARFGARRNFSEWFYFNQAGLQRVVEFAGFRVTATSPFLYYRRGPGVKLTDLSLGTILKYTLGRAACSVAVKGEV
jgi:tRNA (mo5U34)-methyltransferase